MDNSVYCIDKDNKNIVIVNISLLEINFNLVILVLSSETASSLSEVSAWFNIENPDINIKFKEIASNRNEYYNTLTTKTLAGDVGFNIFILDSSKSPYFIKNDAFLNLGTYPSIKDYFGKMFEGMEALCS